MRRIILLLLCMSGNMIAFPKKIELVVSRTDAQEMADQVKTLLVN